MKNVHNLPRSLVNAVERVTGRYDNEGADLSVTQLADSPRVVQLLKRHGDKIEYDISELFYQFLGTVVHNMLEEFAPEDALVEERMHMDVGGVHLSGQIDLFEDGVLTDYKLTGAMSVDKKKARDWKWQLNIYAYMLELQGHRVDKLQVMAMLRDWKVLQADRSKSYPQTAFLLVPIERIPTHELEAWLHERVRVHTDAASLSDDDLPECDRDAKWQWDDVWAVKKKGNKTAMRGGLHDSLAEARKFASEVSVKTTIEHRPGRRLRCEKFCPVRRFCRYA